MGLVIQIFASIATASSVLWAIFVFKRTEERRLFAKTRESLSKLKFSINEIDSFLGQAHFAFLADSIVNELKQLKSENMSLQQFSDFLTSEENHNLIAQSVHVGRLKCQFINEIEIQLREYDQAVVSLREKLPLVSAVINKLSFYIESPARYSLAPKTFDYWLGNPENIKKVLIPNLTGYDNEEHYFTEIKVYCGSAPGSIMEHDALGQKTFDLAESIIQLVIKSFSSMSDPLLRAASSQQKSLEIKMKKIDNQHAAEDAIDYLKLIKSNFSDEDWDYITESKAKIVQLMTDD